MCHLFHLHYSPGDVSKIVKELASKNWADLYFIHLYYKMSSGEDARNVPPKITLFCHPQNEFNYVSCILCDSPYCKSDFARKVNKGKGFFITNTLVVCAEHNITYNSKHEQDTKSENFDELSILRLKAELINQEILNLTTSEDGSSDGCDEEEIETNTEIQSSNAVLSMGMLIRDNKQAKTIIKELKETNKELIENNKFLRANFENNHHCTKYSYSAATKTSSDGPIIPNNNDIETIFITPKDADSQDIFTDTKKSLLLSKLPIISIKNEKKK